MKKSFILIYSLLLSSTLFYSLLLSSTLFYSLLLNANPYAYATDFNNGEVLVIDVATGLQVGNPISTSGNPNQISIDKNTYAVVTNTSSVLGQISLKTNQYFPSPISFPTYGLTLSKDLKFAFCLSENNTYYVWNQVYEPTVVPGPLTKMALSQDGNYLVGVDIDHSKAYWIDLANQSYSEISGLNMPICVVSDLKEEYAYVTDASNTSLKIVNFSTGEVSDLDIDSPSGAISRAFDQDAFYINTASGILKLFHDQQTIKSDYDNVPLISSALDITQTYFLMCGVGFNGITITNLQTGETNTIFSDRPFADIAIPQIPSLPYVLNKFGPVNYQK